MKILLFDTETTGLLSPEIVKIENQPKIIEIGCLLVDKSGIINEVNQLIHPSEGVSIEITKITGIKNQDLIGKPKFIDFYDNLKPFFNEVSIVICHNAVFDLGMINVELQRNKIFDLNIPETQICTVQEFHHYFGYKPKLTEIYEKFTGKKLIQTHRALDDVKALYEACLGEGLIENIFNCMKA